MASFKAYAIKDTAKWHDFEVIDFEPKRMEDHDVEIAIEYCGVCASDVHTITGGWGAPILPMITGHEIAGKVTKVGPKVTEFKVGDRAGVGAQAGSCYTCKRCTSDQENYCPNMVDTYNAKYPNGDIAHGGYSSGIRAHQQFVFKIPDAVALEDAASMLCGGLTVYSPLIRAGLKKGSTVVVNGLGGLGHYAVLWSKAIGASEIIVFSHTADKKDAALKMGATKFICTKDTSYADSGVKDIDIVLNTVDLADKIAVEDLAALTTVEGYFCNVAMPDDPASVKFQGMAANACKFMTTHIGSKKECNAMLKLAAEHNIKPYIQVTDMKNAGEAVRKLYADRKGEVRFRQVLKQDLVQY